MSSTRICAASFQSAAFLFSGCDNRQIGYEAQRAEFGFDVNDNARVQSVAFGGQQELVALSESFRRSAPDMINFQFNSAVLGPEAQRILDMQASWIARYPYVRLRIYGHTDLVGSAEYNQALGQRRANTAAAYLVSRGVARNQLEAVVSLGKTRPLIATSSPERKNRRTVTEVAGYVGRGAGFDFDGKRAHEVYKDYVAGETPELTQVLETTDVFVP